MKTFMLELARGACRLIGALIALALVLLIYRCAGGGSVAHAATRHQGASVAACEAKVAQSFRWMLTPAPADLQADPTFHDNPEGDYKFMVWAAQKQRCHHIDMGLDKPLDHVVEVQVRGTITVQREP